MFYRLNEKLLLRGWQKLPYAVVNKADGHTFFVSKEVFDVLDLANGKIDFTLPMISDSQRAIAEKLVEDGALIPSDVSGEIDNNQKYYFYDNRFMDAVHWSVTGRCNYKCKHCYMSACDNKYDELSHEDIMKIIDELAECGIHRISLTGGEALVRKDFFEIVDALTKNDIVIRQVYSNGALVNEKTLSEFEKRGLFPEFNMSFDGTEGYHEWLRGVPGADKAIDRAFRLCREHGFPTGAEMCIHDRNKHTLRDTVNYLASVGCRSLKTNPISNVGAWYENGYGPSIAMKDLFEIYLDYILKYYEDGKPLSIQLGGFFSASKEKDSYVIPVVKSQTDPDTFCVCGHARNHMYISAEGRVLPCMALSGMEIQNVFPLITEYGLKNCLNDSTYLELITTKAREVLNHNERCDRCEFANRCCGGCRAAALENNPHDIMAIDEAACLIFKGGYIERINEAVKQAKCEKEETSCQRI